MEILEQLNEAIKALTAIALATEDDPVNDLIAVKKEAIRALRLVGMDSEELELLGIKIPNSTTPNAEA